MTRPHHYVHCDVPEGMTLAEYRGAKRQAAKPRKTGLVARLRRRRVAGADLQRRAA
ncbi:MAG TPA: hypothetical protein VGJ32_16005 [Solirubrobacteraceae bacterium]|jgi:hypothetical protein